MTPLTRSACWIVVALASALVGVGRADDKKPTADDDKKPTVMRRKLAHAQKVLEGLAVNDFDKIRTGSDGLIACVQDETWKINQTETYLLYSNEFVRRAERLKKAAKDKNTDAAALAYVDLTLTCVRCHQYLRDER
ncbi:hypothetical protein [Frigoriglobus tundricola]|uniref:Secreted protein n=1 Tax=Frigoriglobus tundricola TaxID=2774151 RepID=A0A6M5YNS2_9BACT|nr:hypothetical protein [Frigoriglobus tundricola]QJW94976.1 hypothetical protein FTUN_2502 [Frigoriglobus tundricola]